MNKSNIFLLCVGSQKAGTTWLYKELSKNRNVNFGLLKEYHIWDTPILKFTNNKPLINYKKFSFFDFPKKIFYEKEYTFKEGFLIYLLNKFRFFYFIYFKNILIKNNEISITGDFTPTYGILEMKTLEKIKNRFENYNIEVKVIFITRDPIERYKSLISYFYNKPKYKKIVNNSNKNVFSFFLEDELFTTLTRYEVIIDKFKKVFGENFIVIDYGQLFNNKTIDLISKFLNIESKNVSFKKVNVTKDKISDLQFFEKKLLKDNFKNTYMYMEKNFNSIYKLWQD